jgi:hypothetical protein
MIVPNYSRANNPCPTIELHAVSFSGGKLIALLRRGARSRLVDVTGLDLAHFSAAERCRAWRQASGLHARRQFKIGIRYVHPVTNPAA